MHTHNDKKRRARIKMPQSALYYPIQMLLDWFVLNATQWLEFAGSLAIHVSLLGICSKYHDIKPVNFK
jgi:hypothetical protein